MERNLDTEAAIIINDLKSLTLRIDGLEASPPYTSALYCVKKAISCMEAGRCVIRVRRMNRRHVSKKTDSLFNMSVMELDVTPRIANMFQNENVVTVGDLVQKTEQDLMRMPNFGRRSLTYLKEVLATMGLYLGMGENQS
jgi:DNA-directed RNA polymerase alpha subunit